jgi:S-DNA-T family DNA segregation ATPase FtsK/SpoIIIE
VIAGPRRSGRSNALVALAAALIRQGSGVIAIVAPLPSPLEQLVNRPGVLAVLNGRTAGPDDLNNVLAAAPGPVAVLVDDADRLLDAPLAPALEALLRSARELQRAVVIAGGTAEINAASFRGLVAEAKKSRAGLLLSPSGPTDGEFLGIRLPKSALFNGPAGRAVQVDNGALRLVQVALAPPTTESPD